METKTIFKSYTEFDLFLENGHLTELCTRKINGKKKTGNNLSVIQLLTSYMREYGLISAYASTNLRNENGKDWGVEFTAFNINEDFPIENEALIKLLYGYEEGIVNIGFLPGNKNDEDCAFAFDYNLSTGEVTFKKLYYGSTRESKHYDTLVNLLEAINDVEDINTLF